MENLWLALIGVYLFSAFVCAMSVRSVTPDKWIPAWVAMMVIILVPGINTIVAGVIVWKSIKIKK